MDEDENPKQIGAIQKYVKAQPKSIQSKADFQNINPNRIYPALKSPKPISRVSNLYMICSFGFNVALLSSPSSSAAPDMAS